MAAYAIQFRRGTTTEHSSFTGLLGEVTVDTTKHTVVVHDGSTAGGFALALDGAAQTTSTGTFTSNVTVGGTLAVTGLTTMSGAAAVTGDLTMTGHVLPSANITYDLGSTTHMWRDVYIGPGSLYINGHKVIEDDSGTINFTTDINQDLKFTTSGTGTLKLIGANGINFTGQIGAVSGDLQIGDHMDMNSSLIKQLATPVSGTDAANKTYVDSAASSAVTGGTNAVSGTTGTFSSNMTVGGNLTVNGTTTYIATEAITLADNILILNSNATGTPSENGGFEVERGDSLNVQFLWNETDDRWTTGSASLHAGAIISPAFTGDLTGDVTGNTSGSAGTVTSISAHLKDEDDMSSDSATHVPTQQSVKAYVTSQIATKDNTDEMTEGSTNLYFTDARADARITAANTADLSEGTNLYYTDARADARITNALIDEDNMASDSATRIPSQQSVKAYVASQLTTQDNTDEMTEGTTNLYFTDARARGAISVSGDISYNSTTGVITTTGLASSDTGDLAEGSNLYYTNARADARITNALIDEDNFVSDSATRIPSQQSVKAYVASQISTKDNTDEMTEGTTNLYYTTARWDSAFGTSTTTGLTEGTNKYYTDARADARTAVATATNTTAWEAHSDASEAAAIASAESKDVARASTAVSNIATAKSEAIASASSDATTKADAAQAAAIASAEAKDVVRAATAAAYTDSEITALIGGAPGALDTLNELAAAINDDASYSATLTALVGTKLALAGGAMTGAITTTSTFDGRDVATDGTKLDGIEANATADQTAAQLLTAIKTVDGAGSGLDADLLDGNSSAYFTGYADTAETDARAYTDTRETAITTALQTYADTAETDAIASALSSAESKDVARMVTSDAYADAAEAAAIASAESKDAVRATAANAYADAAVAVLTAGASTSLDTLLEISNVMATDTELSDAITALNHDSLSGFVANEHIDWTVTGNTVHADNYTDTTYSVQDGQLSQVNFTTADNVKLDGIETGATADQTAAQLLTAIKTVDGAGSGLDADLLDGNSSAYFTDYTDTAETDARAYTDTRETAITTAYQSYADTAETDAVATAATAAQVKVDALESSLTHFHSDLYTAVAADETGTVGITFYEDNSITTPVEVGMATARHYAVYVNRQLMRASEYSVSGTTVTIIAGILALDDELEVTGFKS